jgi:hypothetical protein
MNANELEEQFKKIDQLSNEQPIEANITGPTESSGNLSVSAGTKSGVAAGGLRGVAAQPATLLNIDLGAVDVSDAYIDAAIAKIFSNQPKGSGMRGVGTNILPGIKVMQIGGASQNYQVVEDYAYDADGGYHLIAPKDFIYDRASIPRIFWVIVSKDDLSNVAPVFHDLLYRNGGVLPQSQVTPYRTFIREEVDKLFFELAGKCGVTPWRARLAYQAVRNFGGPSWQSHP